MGVILYIPGFLGGERPGGHGAVLGLGLLHGDGVGDPQDHDVARTLLLLLGRLPQGPVMEIYEGQFSIKYKTKFLALSY